METEKSKIPVYRLQPPKEITVPKDTQVLFHSKKQSSTRATDLEPPKVPVFAFGTRVPDNFVFKGTNQRLTKTTKKAAPSSPKKAEAAATFTVRRYKREAELKNKNKRLEASKCELSVKLAEVQTTVKELTKRYDGLEKEHQKLKEFQKSYMFIDSGDNVLKEAAMVQNQTEIMSLTEKLNADLELFNQMAKEQKDKFQNAKATWKQVEEERIQLLEQQQSFHREMEEFAAALEKDLALLNL